MAHALILLLFITHDSANQAINKYFNDGQWSFTNLWKKLKEAKGDGEHVESGLHAVAVSSSANI